MDISVRLYTILHKHGIENIEDVGNYTSDDIIYWKDIGRIIKYNEKQRNKI